MDRNLHIFLLTILLLGYGATSMAAPATGPALDLSQWMALLHDKQSQTRNTAIEALGESGDPRALLPLIGALHDPVADNRSTAMFELCNFDDPAAVKPIIKCLADRDEDARESAASALGYLHDRQAVDALIGALKDPSSDVCSSAAQSLGMIGDPRAVPALKRLLRSSDSYVCQDAARALGHLKDPSIPLLLVSLLGNGKLAIDDEFGEIAKCQGKPIVDLLITRLEKPQKKSNYSDFQKTLNSDIIETIYIQTLDYFDDPRITDCLLKVCQTARPDADFVRTVCAKALRRHANARALPVLRSLLRENQSEIRQYAAEALGRVHEKSAVDLLLTAATDSDPVVCGYALSALEKQHTAQAIDGMLSLLHAQNAKVRADAAFYLGDLGETRAIGPLIQALTHDDHDARLMIEALGTLHAAAAIDVITPALTDPDPKVRLETVFALGRIGNVKAVPALIALLANETNSDISRAAIYALESNA